MRRGPGGEPSRPGHTCSSHRYSSPRRAAQPTAQIDTAVLHTPPPRDAHTASRPGPQLSLLVIDTDSDITNDATADGTGTALTADSSYEYRERETAMETIAHRDKSHGQMLLCFVTSKKETKLLCFLMASERTKWFGGCRVGKRFYSLLFVNIKPGTARSGPLLGQCAVLPTLYRWIDRFLRNGRPARPARLTRRRRTKATKAGWQFNHRDRRQPQ